MPSFWPTHVFVRHPQRCDTSARHTGKSLARAAPHRAALSFISCFVQSIANVLGQVRQCGRYASSSSNALACFRSTVSKPSVNQS
jgi:hypothetical protein